MEQRMVKCVKLGRELPGLSEPPFDNELGQRIYEKVSADAWRMCTDGVAYPRLAWESAVNGDLACPDGVALEDFAGLAQRWLMTDCDQQNNCGGGDLDGSDSVDESDLLQWFAFWLVGR